MRRFNAKHIQTHQIAMVRFSVEWLFVVSQTVVSRGAAESETKTNRMTMFTVWLLDRASFICTTEANTIGMRSRELLKLFCAEEFQMNENLFKRQNNPKEQKASVGKRNVYRAANGRKTGKKATAAAHMNSKFALSYRTK